MYTRKAKVINKTGLHARPASDLTMKAKRFESDILLRNMDKEDAESINVKSIMKVLASGITCGTQIEITAEGRDEKTAVDTLIDLIESGFGEKSQSAV